MMLKRLFIGCLLTCVGVCACAQQYMQACSDSITYVGRTLVRDTAVCMDWTGAYLRVSFYGKQLEICVSDTGRNYYNLYIDRDIAATPDSVLTITGDTTIALNLPSDTTHTLTLYKRTEGEHGCTIFRHFLTDGHFMQAPKLKPRQIEFIGDSYTCGYGAENTTQEDHFTPETETPAKSFASIVARYFNADYTIIAHSGMGVARNFNSKFAGYYMPERYTQIFDMDRSDDMRWDTAMSDFRPQITVILLGGNDFSTNKKPSYTDFERNYIRMLKQIKANYGEDHPILCCTKKNRDEIFAYVQKVVRNCGMKNVSYCPLFANLFHDDERNLGADFHPNYEAHRKIAYVLIPYVATMTEWELQDTSAFVSIQ